MSVGLEWIDASCWRVPRQGGMRVEGRVDAMPYTVAHHGAWDL